MRELRIGILAPEEAQEACELVRVTVNSSPFAVPAYAGLGFRVTGETEERDGIIFVPMEFRVAGGAER
jgi:predicted GNAT family N-acyltransferase